MSILDTLKAIDGSFMGFESYSTFTLITSIKHREFVVLKIGTVTVPICRVLRIYKGSNLDHKLIIMNRIFPTG